MNIVVVSSVGENILELYDGLPGPSGPAGPAGPAGTTDHLLLTNIGVNSHVQIDAHISNTSNPHVTTKFQVGLGNVQNVDNTNPANIVQSSSYRFATDAEKASWNSKEPAIPAGLINQFWRGDKTWASPTKLDVGLGNVDNTSDLSKDLGKFEKIARNLRSYPHTFSYVGGKLAAITYTTGPGTTIVRTFNFSGSDIISVVLSGTLPSELGGITTKTFTYSAGKISAVSYS